jgi:5-methyltetrahydropteroyltriglutamate--homocysteine methyltransferase
MMKRSTDRILTTHIGSLPRSPRLLELLLQKQIGQAVDSSAFENQVQRDLAEIVSKQQEVGIDVAGDGELPRIGFSFYVKDRMSGFGGVANRGTMTDFKKFPGYGALKARASGIENITKTATAFETPECQSEIKYDPTMSAAKQELDWFADALTASDKKFSETFVTSATPGIISTTLLRSKNNSAYKDDAEYLDALAEELRKEYELIVSYGHILQIDAPDLAMERQIMYADQPLDAFLKRVELHIAVLNKALRNIAKDKVRLHVCWGNWDGPHIDDVELEPLLPLLYQANVGALSLACANHRHQHDYKMFKKHRLPPDMILIPGVIDVTTNYLEHPEVVADRLETFVETVGDKTRIIAGLDCGFSTFAGYTMVADDVVWAKLRMLTEGARIASNRLY